MTKSGHLAQENVDPTYLSVEVKISRTQYGLAQLAENQKKLVDSETLTIAL